MPRMMLVALGFLAGLLLLTSAGLTRWWTEDEGEKTLDGLTLALHDQGDSGRSGWATLVALGDTLADTRVTLSLGAEAASLMGSQHAHLHAGQCHSLGGTVHFLNSIGDGDSTTMLGGVSLDSLLTGSFAIDTHNPIDPYSPTTCGDLPDAESMPLATNEDTLSVGLSNFKFLPTTLEVEPGETAQFTVTSSGAPHTFTVPDLGIDIVLPAGTEHTIEIGIPAEAAGELALICRYHEGLGMIGKLLVAGPDDPSPTPTAAVPRPSGAGGY